MPPVHNPEPEFPPQFRPHLALTVLLLPPLVMVLELGVWYRPGTEVRPVLTILVTLLATIASSILHPAWFRRILSWGDRMLLTTPVLGFGWMIAGITLNEWMKAARLLRWLGKQGFGTQLAGTLGPLLLGLLLIEVGRQTIGLLRRLWTSAGSRRRVLPLPDVDPAPVQVREAEILVTEGNCPYCGDPLATGPARLCPACETPHHRECWETNRGCTTYACRGGHG